MLKISRSDIRSDIVEEYSAATRFIKLPIVPYLKLAGYWESINRPQIALINAANSPKYRFICAALARRLGKTLITNVVGQLVTLMPGSSVLIISPNYNLSGISFDLQRMLVKKFDLEVARDNVKDKILELSNGSTIRMGSVTTVDSCVGRSYDLIIFDEAALSEGGKEAFEIALRPTLDKPGAKAIFISTPRGVNNWFSEFFNRGFSDDFPQWCSLQADYTENDRMSEADVAEARKSMSAAAFEQEYMASFTTFEGQIYSFDRENDCVEYTWMPGDELIAGIDPGYKDPTALVVLAYRPSEDCFYAVRDYLKSEDVTAGHVEAWQEIFSEVGQPIDPIFIDSAAAQFAADLAYTYEIATVKGKKDVLAGIAYVQTLVQQRRLKVDPSCTHVLAALDQYRWDTKEGLTRERPKHDNFSHMADALRYALYTYTI